ncbi:MAG: AraC family transcriptional regulator, partial [Pseudolabrys sp.]
GWDAIDLIAKNTPLLPWLKKWHDRGAYIAGVCTASHSLLNAGCSTASGQLPTGASPIFWASATPRFVGNPSSLSRKTAVFSAVAGSTPRSTSVSIWSKNSAVTKSHFSAPNRSCSACHAGRQSGYSVVQLSRPHSDEKIRQSEEYLQQHFDRDISIDILARQAGMGPRNFIRRFKAATGRVPGAYLQTLRVSAAKEML